MYRGLISSSYVSRCVPVGLCDTDRRSESGGFGRQNPQSYKKILLVAAASWGGLLIRRYIYLYLSIYLSIFCLSTIYVYVCVYIYMHTYVYVCVCVCVCV